jgi:hypothetical protein
VVPIAPSVQEKRNRAEQQTDIKEDESALSELDVSACKTYGPRILLAANRALAALSEAGLVVGFDVNPRVRAAQKFEKWERRGLRVRLEIGLREADSDTVSIRVAQQISSLVFYIFTICSCFDVILLRFCQLHCIILAWSTTGQCVDAQRLCCCHWRPGAYPLQHAK